MTPTGCQELACFTAENVGGFDCLVCLFVFLPFLKIFSLRLLLLITRLSCWTGNEE